MDPGVVNSLHATVSGPSPLPFPAPALRCPWGGPAVPLHPSPLCSPLFCRFHGKQILCKYTLHTHLKVFCAAVTGLQAVPGSALPHPPTPALLLHSPVTQCVLDQEPWTPLSGLGQFRFQMFPPLSSSLHLGPHGKGDPGNLPIGLGCT